MKTQDTWSFSAPLAEVNVRRILREARVADGNVARFTIDGKVYTAWLEDAFPEVADPGGARYWVADENSCFRLASGEVRIATPDSAPSYSLQIRIQNGDHVAALYDRVAVTVEKFAAPKK